MGSRDNARTPYQWDDSADAGFTTGTPRLKVNPRYTEINLAADRKDPNGIFAYYQKLIAMRKEHHAILDGELEFLLEDHEQLVVYLRRCEEQTLLVAVNMSDKPAAAPLPEQVTGRTWQRILSNREDAPAGVSVGSWLPWRKSIVCPNNSVSPPGCLPSGGRLSVLIERKSVGA